MMFSFIKFYMQNEVQKDGQGYGLMNTRSVMLHRVVQYLNFQLNNFAEKI